MDLNQSGITLAFREKKRLLLSENKSLKYSLLGTHRLYYSQLRGKQRSAYLELKQQAVTSSN